MRYYKEHVRPSSYPSFVLGVDVGGTNTNFGVSGVKKEKPALLFSFHFKTRELTSLIPAVNAVLDYAREKHGIGVTKACVAASGPVSRGHDFCKPTNVEWSIRAKDLLVKTSLESVFIINDFEAIGYGVNLLDEDDRNDVVPARRLTRSRRKVLGATKAVVGAGTGLGKSMLVYEEHCGVYVPVPSEGGHGDFPAQSDFDVRLLEFIRRREGIKQVSCEDVVAGKGIEAIYSFLRGANRFAPTRYTGEITVSGDRVPLIARYRKKDETCRETFRLYARYYARCAKNFVLDAMARGGLYIAGGVASKNREIFKTREFVNEFENVNKQSEILRDTPIYVIVNYNVSLYGACLAAIKREDMAIKKRW